MLLILILPFFPSCIFLYLLFTECTVSSCHASSSHHASSISCYHVQLILQKPHCAFIECFNGLNFVCLGLIYCILYSECVCEEEWKANRKCLIMCACVWGASLRGHVMTMCPVIGFLNIWLKSLQEIEALWLALNTWMEPWRPVTPLLI